MNCTKFGQLILRKIIEIVATRCHILSLKCTKFNFGWGGGAYSAPPDTVAGFKGPTSKGREGRKRRERGGGEEGDGMGEKEKEGRVRGRGKGKGEDV